MRILGQPYQVPNRKGWYLRWTDPLTKKRIAKGFPNKPLAERYRARMICKLNTDIYDVVPIPLEEAAKEYLKKYELRGLSNTSKIDAEATLKRFGELVNPVDVHRLHQRAFDAYITSRKEKVSPYTVNKDISNLRAFLAWAKNNRYITTEITLHKVKTEALNHKALTIEQIRYLFKQCPSLAWRSRLLLSLVTGLRAGDIDRLDKSSLDIKRASIATVSRKTGKANPNRPLPGAAIPEIDSYVKTLPKGQLKLFDDINVRKTWGKIAGDSGITRQDLRRTFSTLIQMVGSIGTAQNLLEHYDSKTTSRFYSDEELILRWKVNQLPVEEWFR